MRQQKFEEKNSINVIFCAEKLFFSPISLTMTNLVIIIVCDSNDHCKGVMIFFIIDQKPMMKINLTIFFIISPKTMMKNRVRTCFHHHLSIYDEKQTHALFFISSLRPMMKYILHFIIGCKKVMKKGQIAMFFINSLRPMMKNRA